MVFGHQSALINLICTSEIGDTAFQLGKGPVRERERERRREH